MSDALLDFGSQNAAYVEQLYQQFLRDPERVAGPWQEFFRSGANGNGRAPAGKPAAPPSKPAAAATTDARPAFERYSVFNPPCDDGGELDPGRLQDRVGQLLRAYRVRGHLAAHLDPLGVARREVSPELDLSFYGLAEADLDRTILDRHHRRPATLTLREILERLRNTYCRSIGVQFMHIDDLTVRDWLQERMEGTENRIDAAARRAAAHPHAADRRRDLRGVHPARSSSAPRAFRWKGPRA